MKSNHRFGSLVGAVLLCVSASVDADDPKTRTVAGKAYEGEQLALADSSTPLYSVSVTTQKSAGIDRLQVVDVDRNGKSFFTQTIDFDAGLPKVYTFANSSAKQSGKLTVTPTELVMEYTEAGKTNVAREPRPSLFAVGASVMRLVEQHITDLSAGRTVSFRMVVVNRLETYGFRIVRDSVSANEPIAQLKSGKWLRVRIEADGGLARMFAPKIVSIVDAQTGQPLAFNGPIPSMRADGTVIKDGTIRYAAFQ